MRTFKQFFKEQAEKTAVIAYGRYNPPTIGHQKLIDTVSRVANEHTAQGYIAPSHTQNSKTDPLTFDEKKEVLNYMLPENISILESGKTFVSLLQDLQANGFKNVVHVAGSDRIPEFESLVAKYNGKPNKKGEIPFQFDSYTFVSAGQRDPDSEGVEGMSASKLRKAATENDINTFLSGVSDSVPTSVKEQIFNKIRERINI